MRKRLVIYCEGQTEELIVKRLLRDHLKNHGVNVRPELCATSLDPHGQRGGFVNWDAIEFDLKQTFLRDPALSLRFTTLLDVYRMPSKLLKMAGFTDPVSEPQEVDAVQRAIESVFDEPRFTAYLQRHELEALLLADTDALERVFRGHIAGIQRLRAEIAGFDNPEDINHGATTHPSARLANAVVGYEDLKASHAYWVLAESGLDAVRARCPRFHTWLSQWEEWGMNP